MITSAELLNEYRTRPVYTIMQAARLAGTTSATVRRWLYGYRSPSAQMRPVFGNKRRSKEPSVEISFLQLAEIVVVARYRHRGIKLERLRRAHKYAREQFEIEYPFASLKLKTDGAHVLGVFSEMEPGESLIALDQFGQWVLPGDIVKTLELFDYEDDLAMRWFPIGRTVPIVIDPRFGAGKPTIPDRRLTIEAIYKRWRAGQDIRFIASDLKLPAYQVETTLRYAESYAT
jgi:uncharacterized protein (DUF433 family)